MIRQRGTAAVLAEVSGIRPDEPLGELVLSSYQGLRPDPGTALPRLLPGDE
jgi:hypothetical protein